MQKSFAGLFFVPEDAAFADSFRSNVHRLENGYKQALALTVMCRSMTRKVTMGHFAHTQALVYASDPTRIKRNRSLIRPLKDLFIELLPEYNAAIFDNSRENISYNKNILDLLPELDGIDLAYFDPPYCNSHADYQSFYHLLETFVEYWKDKQFVNGIKRYEPKKYSGFDKNSEALANLQLMFERANHIPTWLVSYNDRSYPDIDTMVNMITPYRNVKHRKENSAFIDEDYFKHLLSEIREIRMNERRFYQKLTDIYATSIDYNRDTPTTRVSYKKMQNKMQADKNQSSSR